MMDPTERAKAKRVKTGCLTCRARKVKCDESREVCGNCRSMQIECCWQSREARTDDKTGSPRQTANRVPACTKCREARAKCSQTRPTCARCQLQGLECTYPPSKRKRADSEDSQRLVRRVSSLTEEAAGTEPALPPTERDALEQADSHSPSRELSEKLVSAFFKYVHPYGANGYLHRDTTLRSLRDGKMPKPVLFALWAIGSRFVDPPVAPGIATSWVRAAATRLTMSHSVSRDNITAALLLLTYSQHAGYYNQHHMWCAYANRQVLSLGLHRPTTDSTVPQTWLDSERDRRLYYACYSMERQMSNGTPESIYCPADRIQLPLPCDEFNYRMDVSAQTPAPPLEQAGEAESQWLFHDVGVMGFYVRIVGVRFMIKSYAYKFRENLPTALPWEAGSPFQECVTKLAAIKRSFPDRLQLTPDLAKGDEVGPVVMLVLFWNMCHIDLYRMVLPGYVESIDAALLATAPDDWIQHIREATLGHAKVMTAALDMASKRPREELVITDHTFPRFIYWSIRVQIDLSEDLEARALDEVKRSFEMLLSFCERTSRLLPPARLLYKETRRMIRRHGMSLHEAEGLESRPVTPPHPWFLTQKKVDLERQSATSLSHDNYDLLEGLFSNLLPEGIIFGDTSWMNDVSPTQGFSLPWETTLAVPELFASHSLVDGGTVAPTGSQTFWLDQPSWM